jgi:hypothetical protein
MRVVFTNGASTCVRYLTAGTGPVLLLLHPVGHFADIFVRYVDKLAEDFTVVIDLA